MSVPALIVGAGVVGAIWLGSKKRPIQQLPPAGAGNTNASQGDSYASAPQASVSEPATGIPTFTEASSGNDAGQVMTVQNMLPIDPGRTETITSQEIGLVSQPSTSGSPAGPADGGLPGGKLPNTGVINAGMMKPPVLVAKPTSMLDTVMGSAGGTTKQVQATAFSNWGPRFGAVW